MAGYCLKNGRIQEAWGEDAAGRELAAVFHLTADGEMKELHEFPALSEGEGALLAACRPGAAGIGGTLCHS